MGKASEAYRKAFESQTTTHGRAAAAKAGVTAATLENKARTAINPEAFRLMLDMEAKAREANAQCIDAACAGMTRVADRQLGRVEGLLSAIAMIDEEPANDFADYFASARARVGFRGER